MPSLRKNESREDFLKRRRVYDVAYTTAHREEKRAYLRAYDLRRGKRVRDRRDYMMAYSAAHRQEKRARQAAYRAANRKKVQAANLAWRLKQKEAFDGFIQLLGERLDPGVDTGQGSGSVAVEESGGTRGD